MILCGVCCFVSHRDAQKGPHTLHAETERPRVYLRAARRMIAVPCNQRVVNTLTQDELWEEFTKTQQLVIDDEFGPLGPGGMRAL